MKLSYRPTALVFVIVSLCLGSLILSAKSETKTADVTLNYGTFTVAFSSPETQHFALIIDFNQSIGIYLHVPLDADYDVFLYNPSLPDGARCCSATLQARSQRICDSQLMLMRMNR